MFDVLGIDKDFIIDGLELILIGAWLEHLHHDIQSLPQQRELVAVLVALDETEHQVSNIKGLTPTQESDRPRFEGWPVKGSRLPRVKQSQGRKHR